MEPPGKKYGFHYNQEKTIKVYNLGIIKSPNIQIIVNNVVIAQLILLICFLL